MSQHSFQTVLDALERSGRFYRIRNNECNVRCPVCGDSTKNLNHAHMYINLESPHMVFCQRCGYRARSLTVEILEGLGAAEREASVYVRLVEKNERRSGRSRRRPPSLAVGNTRLKIPQPSMDDEYDRATVQYLEERLGGEPLSKEEIERYRIVTCGLYGFLDANDIDKLTIHQREADRLNDSCIGFLSADESYIIFRTMDDKFVKNGGRRYTNYRIYEEWEGSKSFTARADINIAAPIHNVVCAEGIIDLIQLERVYYPERRWTDSHIGVATCGATHETVLRQMVTLGVMSQNTDLYIDNLPDGRPDVNAIRHAKNLRRTSPFFASAVDFKLSVYRNSYEDEKDFGSKLGTQNRVAVKL